MNTTLDFEIMRQPDLTTCGPTCLHAVYRYYDDPIPLKEVISEVSQIAGGGTLEVYLACHALNRGYKATIYPYNLQIFDPTWWGTSSAEIMEKLSHQLSFKKDNPGIEVVTTAYLEYLKLGGELKFEVITPALIRRYLKRSIPILTGLSATYLYNSPREYDVDGRFVYDDVRGESAGHFVVLAGYNREDRSVLIADPLMPNPLGIKQYYPVNIYRLVCAIMLGILTFDGNLLMIRKPKTTAKRQEGVR